MSTDSIGSDVSRDHANPADWWAAIPATLTEAELGECYNDSEITVSTGWTFTGKTEGAHQITLTTATDESFADDSSNPLRYDSAVGVAFKTTTNYVTLILDLEDGMILSKIQFRQDATGANIINAASDSVIIERCIFLMDGNRICIKNDNTCTIRNNCIIHDNAGDVSDEGILALHANAKAYFNTIAVPTDITSPDPICMDSDDSSAEAKNNACFGSSRASNGTFNGSTEYNATDDTAIAGTNVLTSLTYADQFTDISDAASMDLRVKAGSDLEAAGVAVSGITTDIFGTTRADPPTIGCFEFVAASIPNKITQVNRSIQRASYI